MAGATSDEGMRPSVARPAPARQAERETAAARASNTEPAYITPRSTQAQYNHSSRSDIYHAHSESM